MENSAAGEDRPDLRPFHNAFPWPLLAVAFAATGALIGYAYYVHQSAAELAPAPPLSALPGVLAPPPETLGPPQRTMKPQPEAASLPSLDNSDSMLRQGLVGLMGREAFAELVIPDRLVRRIVATVDNLPRQSAPRLAMPLAGVPGAFDPSNAARYLPYVRVMEAIDVQALVHDYARAYPLFQRAYEELGYPGKYFNDRLIEAIDDLLAAPELDAPPELIRPRIQYEFADPDLETRSAGQKIMLRMGRENAARVKAKLALIRRELVAASERR